MLSKIQNTLQKLVLEFREAFTNQGPTTKKRLFTVYRNWYLYLDKNIINAGIDSD